MSLNKPLLLGGIAALAIGQGALGKIGLQNEWRKTYGPAKGQSSAPTGLDPSQFLAALAGFRELIAGILWVRADSFFDQGNYDAVLPMVRLVTWLDPKQIDVFSTGMWHIAYNFTDEESRSDRRYIPASLALGKFGVEQNPNTYELFYEMGWLYYHKIDDDYDKTVKWWEQAATKKDILPARRNLLANAYLRNGQISKALQHYFEQYEIAAKEYDTDKTFSSRQQRDTVENNIDNTIVRMVQRGFFAGDRKDGSFETGEYDTRPPFDVGFSARVTVEDNKVLRVEGTWGVQTIGSRIRLVLRDADFPNAVPAGMKWDFSQSADVEPDKKTTFLQESLFVRNSRFNKRIDMSKDSTMYSLTSPKYYVEFYYNPRSAPAHIQDRFGFSGEGMTDSRFLNKDARTGQRILYARLELTREQLRRTGEWYSKTPSVSTPGFKPLKTAGVSDSDLIKIPSIRAPKQDMPAGGPGGLDIAPEGTVKPVPNPNYKG